jgi:hypothetical protein
MTAVKVVPAALFGRGGRPPAAGIHRIEVAIDVSRII